MNHSAKQYLDECISMHPSLAQCKTEIEQAFDMLVTCFKNGGKVLTCGNGGSAADADHIIGELMNKFALKRKLLPQQVNTIKSSALPEAEKQFLLEHLQRQLPAISLSAHSPLVTAIANDEHADMIFGQQVFGYGKPGDVLIALSTSGNSKNVVQAVLVAKLFGLRVCAFTGKSGGKLNELGCDTMIRVPEDVTYKIQQLHQPVYHCLCAMVEAELFA